MNLGNMVIFGDSYSTFKGYIPQGYAAYYSEKDDSQTGVVKVSDTWWHQLITQTNSNLVLNNSWSGSTIGYTGYDNSDCSQSSSFIYRFEKLSESGFFKENKIDTVFIFGGTNDSWCGAPMGSLKFSDWSKDDLYCVLPAIAYFFKKLREELSGTNIICIINSDLRPEISDGMKAACEYFGIQAIALENIDKSCGHPTVNGMTGIKDRILSDLSK